MSLTNKKIEYSLYYVCSGELYLSDSVEVSNSRELFEKIAGKHDLVYLNLFTYKYKKAKEEPCNTLYLMINKGV